MTAQLKATLTTAQLKAVRDGVAARGSSGLWVSGLFLFSMLLLFVGERLLAGTGTPRLVLGVLAGLGMLGALAVRLVRRGKVPVGARKVEGLILVCYAGAVVAVLLYLGQSELVMEPLQASGALAAGKTAERLQGALYALFPVIWLCSMLPLLFAEISYAPMDLNRTVEVKRVVRSAGSGLVVATTVCMAFLFNFIASEYDKKVDLSYFKTTRPSESSRKMVQNLSVQTRAVLFFPGANEVQEQVEGYFQELEAASNKFKVEVRDHALEPTLAKEYSVSDNGVVVLVQGKKNQQVQLGTKLERAKGKLKKLDSEFQGAFLKLSRASKVAYLTVGHEERSGEDRDKMAGSSIRMLRDALQKLNYQVRDLGISEGLANEVPADATLVIIVGPRKAFMDSEDKALVKYLGAGGKVMLLIDPETGLDMAGLLGPMGLKYTPVTLAHDRLHIRATYTPADRHFLITNRFSSHASVSSLSQNASRLSMVLLGAGRLDEIPAADPKDKPSVQFTVHAMPDTFADEDGDHAFTAGKEKRGAFELGAVSTVQVPGAKGDKAQGRLLVLGDSDVATDQVLRQVVGAGAFVMDGIKWLGGDEKIIGETASEEDIRIVHSRKEDQIWFYLTIFAMPALVLGGGLLFTLRRRRRS